MITQNEFDCHDCGTPQGDGCDTCIEFFAQQEELSKKEPEEVKCDIKSCQAPLGTTTRYGRNLCERCEHFLVMAGY